MPQRHEAVTLLPVTTKIFTEYESFMTYMHDVCILPVPLVGIVNQGIFPTKRLLVESRSLGHISILYYFSNRGSALINKTFAKILANHAARVNTGKKCICCTLNQVFQVQSHWNTVF